MHAELLQFTVCLWICSGKSITMFTLAHVINFGISYLKVKANGLQSNAGEIRSMIERTRSVEGSVEPVAAAAVTGNEDSQEMGTETMEPVAAVVTGNEETGMSGIAAEIAEGVEIDKGAANANLAVAKQKTTRSRSKLESAQNMIDSTQREGVDTGDMERLLRLKKKLRYHCSRIQHLTIANVRLAQSIHLLKMEVSKLSAGDCS